MQPARAQRIAPRECNQPARSALHRKQSAHRAAQRSALHRNQLAAHCITNNPRECNQPAHRKQSAHRQPTRHASPTAPAKARGFIKTLFFAHRLPHGEHLAPAALHALRSTLRWFRFVRGTNFSKIQFKYIVNCNFVMCS
jgi:hypothetical protein